MTGRQKARRGLVVGGLLAAAYARWRVQRRRARVEAERRRELAELERLRARNVITEGELERGRRVLSEDT